MEVALKAARFHAWGGEEHLSIDDIPEPTPGRGEVAVDVVCSSVNPVDIKIRAGSHRLLLGWRLPHGTGLDFSGVVATVGAGVTALKVGDRVWGSPHHSCPGTAMERTVVSANDVSTMPAGWTFAQAAAMPLVGLTALQCLDRAGLRSSERCLVHGASGAVGQVAVQLALSRGATVIGTCSTSRSRAVEDLGARAIDRRGDWMAEVGQADVVVVAADVDHDELTRRARRGTRVVTIVADLPELVAERGAWIGTLLAGVHMAGWSVRAAMRGVRFHHVLKRGSAADLDRLRTEAESGRLTIGIDSELPLSAIREAHARQAEGPRGKVIVRVRPEPA